MSFADFWQRIEREWAEEEKCQQLYYAWNDADNEDDTEYCDYTDEECVGDKMFCEECPVLTDDSWEAEE